MDLAVKIFKALVVETPLCSQPRDGANKKWEAF
jgi:hypothetical protein